MTVANDLKHTNLCELPMVMSNGLNIVRGERQEGIRAKVSGFAANIITSAAITNAKTIAYFRDEL